MKQLKLLLLLTTFAYSCQSFSQWVFCPGSAELTGLGTGPGIYCFDRNIAIVMGGTTGSPKVFKTTNGGLNFVNITGNITGNELYCGCIVDANTYLVGDGGGNAKIWRTTDGGTVWTTVLTTGGTGGFFNGIMRTAFASNFLVAQSDAPSSTLMMYVSSNGGLNWTSQPQTGVGFTIGSFGTVFCIDNLFYGNGSGTPPRIAWTSNGGNTWTGNTITGISGSLTGAAFNNDKLTGLAVTTTSFPNIARTTNGPAGPWNLINAGTGTSINSRLRWAPNTVDCFLSTWNPSPHAIRRTTNNGLNWISMTTAGINGFVDISIQNVFGMIEGYAISQDGSVIKITTFPSPVGINLYNSTIPTEYILEQNYPNPFNPVTNIRYSIPKSANLTIKIYNILGEAVATVVNQYHNPGNYSVDLYGEGLASGIYYYTITAGEFTDTKKMILVK